LFDLERDSAIDASIMALAALSVIAVPLRKGTQNLRKKAQNGADLEKSL
jgi:hypothetical protein